tara:strand:- start:2393 stop:2659 length:267 start_codon:yes stop_codon:yes gene_type:complete
MKNHTKSEDYDENPVLKEVVVDDTELKEWLVNYVGAKLNPEDENVTVEMIVEVISEEFPEFLLAVAEENFIRGYKQCYVDIETNKSNA